MVGWVLGRRSWMPPLGRLWLVAFNTAVTQHAHELDMHSLGNILGGMAAMRRPRWSRRLFSRSTTHPPRPPPALLRKLAGAAALRITAASPASLSAPGGSRPSAVLPLQRKLSTALSSTMWSFRRLNFQPSPVSQQRFAAAAAMSLAVPGAAPLAVANVLWALAGWGTHLAPSWTQAILSAGGAAGPSSLRRFRGPQLTVVLSSLVQLQQEASQVGASPWQGLL